jgi:hypothetical protein
MSIRRPGFWIAYSLLFLFYIITAITPATDGSNEVLSAGQLWPEAGHTVFMFNIFLPLLAGILVADRIWRDFRSNVRELQRSTPITIHQYILAKYIGSLASVLTYPHANHYFRCGSVDDCQGTCPNCIYMATGDRVSVHRRSRTYIHSGFFAGVPDGYAAARLPGAVYGLLVLGKPAQSQGFSYDQ